MYYSYMTGTCGVPHLCDGDRGGVVRLERPVRVHHVPVDQRREVRRRGGRRPHALSHLAPVVALLGSFSKHTVNPSNHLIPTI